jgi:hypothetical protein
MDFTGKPMKSMICISPLGTVLIKRGRRGFTPQRGSPELVPLRKVDLNQIALVALLLRARDRRDSE